MKTIDLHELDSEVIDDERWIIKDWLGVQDLHMVTGEGACCKSWTILDLALSVSRNLPFAHKFPIETPCRILYIDEESEDRRLRKRIKQLAIGRGQPPSYWSKLVTFWGKNKVTFNKLAGTQLAVEVADIAPDLIIIDSLFRANTLDENKAGDVRRVLDWLDAIRAKHNCGITVIQHDKKRQPGDKSLRARDMAAGSRAFFDGSDTVWSMRWEGDVVKIQLGKSRATMSKKQIEAASFSIQVQQTDNDGIRVVTK